MNCPKCDTEMEFEEAKNNCGYFNCGECGFECEGERFPVSDGDGLLEYEERKT